MIPESAVQQSKCNLLLDNKLDFLKNPANIYRFTQMCPKSNVVFYRWDHHRQTGLLLIMIFFSYMEKKNRPQHKEYKEHKEYFICRDTGKIVIMFSETFPQNIYVAYLVCAHPIVTKKTPTM